jgi:hypothetical protein
MIPTEPSLALLRDVLATGILTDPFMLVDVGASGGIAPWWYAFGAHLRAVGFDPLVAEMQRQQALRPHEGITYVAIPPMTTVPDVCSPRASGRRLRPGAPQPLAGRGG